MISSLRRRAPLGSFDSYHYQRLQYGSTRSIQDLHGHSTSCTACGGKAPAPSCPLITTTLVIPTSLSNETTQNDQTNYSAPAQTVNTYGCLTQLSSISGLIGGVIDYFHTSNDDTSLDANRQINIKRRLLNALEDLPTKMEEHRPDPPELSATDQQIGTLQSNIVLKPTMTTIDAEKVNEIKLKSKTSESTNDMLLHVNNPMGILASLDDVADSTQSDKRWPDRRDALCKARDDGERVKTEAEGAIERVADVNIQSRRIRWTGDHQALRRGCR